MPPLPDGPGLRRSDLGRLPCQGRRDGVEWPVLPHDVRTARSRRENRAVQNDLTQEVAAVRAYPVSRTSTTETVEIRSQSWQR